MSVKAIYVKIQMSKLEQFLLVATEASAASLFVKETLTR